MKIYFATSWLLFLVVTASFGQDVCFSRKAVQNDLLFARDQLGAKHPGMYRYASEKAVQENFQKLFDHTPDSVDYWQAYSYLSQLVVPIKCGHTRLFPNEEALEALKKEKVFFPLPTRWLNDSLYVELDTDKGTERWWRVETINGNNFRELLSFLEQRVALDGDSRKGKQLFFDNLAYYYALWMEQPHRFSLRLHSLEKNRQDTLLTVDAVNWETLGTIRKKKGLVFGSGSLFPLSFNIEDKMAFLTVRNFNQQRHKSFGVYFPKFIDSVFRQIKTAGVQHLVIDIRSNGGGLDSYGALLFSYLTNKPFRYFSEVVALKNGKYTRVPHPQIAIQQPGKRHYTGPTTLLIDGLTFSTAADFAALFKEQKRGRIIGMETGGALQGNNSGESEEVKLPHTGAILSIPLWRYTNAVACTTCRRGVEPDIEVVPDTRWLRPGYDAVLELAVQQK